MRSRKSQIVNYIGRGIFLLQSAWGGFSFFFFKIMLLFNNKLVPSLVVESELQFCGTEPP